jgi:hypothetical protein
MAGIAENMATRILTEMGLDPDDPTNEFAVECWNQACKGIVDELKESLVIKIEGVQSGDDTVFGSMFDE